MGALKGPGMPGGAGRRSPVRSAGRWFERAEDHRWLTVTALVLFVAGVAAGIGSLALVRDSRRDLTMQNDTLLASERLLSSVKDIETGVRGYALTGDVAYLVPLSLAEARLPDELRMLDIGAREKDRLAALVGAKERFTRSVIAQRRRGAVTGGAELSIMNQIRSTIAAIQDRAHRTIRRIDRRESVWLTLLGVVSGVALPLSFLWVMAIGLVRRRRVGDANDRLRVSEERHRLLIESSAAIIWTAYPDGRLRGRQRSWTQFTGQERAQYDGDGWLDVVHPDDRASARAAWQEAVGRNGLYSTEMRIRRADGAWRDMQARAVPVLNEGETREWVGTHTDITAAKEAQEQLRLAKENAELANRTKSEFLANMSHELRTPLSAIIGYSELMGEEIEGGCEARELAPDMAKVESNARHLLGLINDVLDLSKVESGKMDVFAETFAVDAMLRDMAATVGGLVAKRGNTLALELAAGLGTADTDLVKTRQVLLNLLSNAAKFTENGTITLSASRETGPDGGDWLRVSVRDSGIGMSADELAKLFQRFSQADVSTTRRFGGTGLGLSLTKAFAEMLGGRVTVASAPGQGSTFTLHLPAVYAPAADAGGAETPEGREDPAWDLVLVIDDDADQRALITRVLRREKFRVRVAADGRSGLAEARRLRPRAILLDVLMPGIDGWSVLTELKADPDLSAIPVVMVTSVDQRSLAVSLGAADYMTKPVQWDRLSQVVNRFRSPHGRILLVEDEFATRLALRGALERDGWTVAEASDGAEALESASRETPSAVLLDLSMPVMDGFRFLEELRRLPGCAAVPVVVMTARELSREDRQRLRGASQILNRGDVSLQDLTERLQRVAEEPSG